MIRLKIPSKLIQNSAKLLSANVYAQAIGLVVYPILARLYAPEDFGVLNLFLSIGSIFILLSTVSYQLAIVLPKQEKQAIAVVHLCLTIALVVSGVVLISVPFAGAIANLFKTPSLAKWYFLLPIYILVMAGWNILSYWYIRHAEYDRNSGYQVLQSSLGAGMKIGLGYGGYLQSGMIVSVVVAPLFALLTSCILAWKNHIRPLLCHDWDEVREVATLYRKFPTYSFPSSMLNMLSSQLPILLLTPVFGNVEIGLWSMAVLLGFAPLSMISKSLNQALYQHTMDLLHQGRSVIPTFRRFSIGTLGIVVPGFAILYLFLPQLTTLLLGHDWEQTGHILRWMLPWLAINILTASTRFLAGIYFKQHVELLFEILLITLRVSAIVIGIYTSDFKLFTILYSMVSFAVAAAHYTWLMILIKRFPSFKT